MLHEKSVLYRITIPTQDIYQSVHIYVGINYRTDMKTKCI